MQTPISYVLGFVFDKCRENVLLIEKQKPALQKGKLNGIGGKIEPGEYPYQAMVREFQEETGLHFLEFGIPTKTSEGVDYNANITYHYCLGGRIFIYRGFTDDIFDAKTMEIERVVVTPVDELRNRVKMPNLDFLIPMLLNEDVAKMNQNIFEYF